MRPILNAGTATYVPRGDGGLCAIGVSNQLRNARGGVGLHARQNVRVLVHRELWGVVPEPF